ncbi:hypothetical protein TcasGA2_TC008133 [Tribolium castaneum]|uniref:Uncharacterized protein n=1 Tax=Tribolium castaneum TaxID=7070 RepID=D1ZZZ6_TRICA|nr:hypothetical protein TcasGA2_TC008133 [Tribolium castaneum]
MRHFHVKYAVGDSLIQCSDNRFRYTYPIYYFRKLIYKFTAD